MTNTNAPVLDATLEEGTEHSSEYDTVANGVRLRIRQVGAPDAPPVVFLHGIMGHRRDWDVLIGRLGEHHRVVAVDQRGHGRSEWTRTYRLVDLADDAIDLIDRIADGPVPVVGHSMGAMVALDVAARRRDLVDRIVLIDIVPDCLDTDFGRRLPDVLEAMARARYASVDEAVTEWASGNPLARLDLLRNYVEHALVGTSDGRLCWGFDAIGLRSFAAGVGAATLWAAADAVRCPSLVVRGEHSPITTDDQVEEFARRLGNAPVVEIAGGGHDLGVEQPESVADAVLRFLGRSGNESDTAS